MRRLSALRLPPVLRPFAVGAGVAVVLLLIGLEPVGALALAGVAVVVVSVWRVLDTGARAPWPQPRTEESDGVRRDVASLSWTFVGREGRVSEAAVRQLRGVADRRLARVDAAVPGGVAAAVRGTAPPETTARARELLGDRAWRVLTSRGGDMPRLREVVHCIDRLEALVPDRTTDERQRP